MPGGPGGFARQAGQVARWARWVRPARWARLPGGVLKNFYARWIALPGGPGCQVVLGGQVAFFHLAQILRQVARWARWVRVARWARLPGGPFFRARTEGLNVNATGQLQSLCQVARWARWGTRKIDRIM